MFKNIITAQLWPQGHSQGGGQRGHLLPLPFIRLGSTQLGVAALCCPHRVKYLSRLSFKVGILTFALCAMLNSMDAMRLILGAMNI